VEIEVRHARVVVAVAETRSISKASVRLCLPQPSLSAQLRRIEKIVGGPLFVRSRLGVEPTVLGERLIPMMAELAAHADAISARANAFAPGPVLRIGSVEWTPFGLQQSIIAALPGTEVRTETLDSPAAAIAAIDRGQLDAALFSGVHPELRGRADGPKLGTRVVVSEPVWVALPDDGRRTRAGLRELPDLRDLRWVQRARDHSFHEVEEQFFLAALGAEPQAVHRAASNAEAMSWVREAGVAALATPTAATREVALLEPEFEVPRDKFTLVWRRQAIGQQSLGGLVRALRAYYLEYVQVFPCFRTWLTANPAGVPELTRLLAGH